MTSLELAKSIYDKSILDGKKNAWVSEKQERYMFSLLYKEGKIGDSLVKFPITIGSILPDGTWVSSITIDEAIKIGEEKIKRVKLVQPVFYIRREGFQAKRIIVTK